MIRYPLTTAPDTEALIRANTFVTDADGEVLADCGILGRSHEDNEAFARKIVDALNAEHTVSQRALASAYRPGNAL